VSLIVAERKSARILNKILIKLGGYFHLQRVLQARLGIDATNTGIKLSGEAMACSVAGRTLACN
jgi:hypothetical protein